MANSTRVAIYVRVSTQEQSCELQQRELLEFAQVRGWTVKGIYEDKGCTGTNNNRPQLRELMRDARARKFDLILVWKLDRFARSLKDLVVMIRELSELGVAFVSLKDQIDLTTAAGMLMLHIIGAFAEFEASLIKERVRAGIANARSKGQRLGRPKLRDDIRIQEMRAKGVSLRTIASALQTSLGSVQRSLSSCKHESF